MKPISNQGNVEITAPGPPDLSPPVAFIEPPAPVLVVEDEPFSPATNVAPCSSKARTVTPKANARTPAKAKGRPSYDHEKIHESSKNKDRVKKSRLVA